MIASIASAAHHGGFVKDAAHFESLAKAREIFLEITTAIIIGDAPGPTHAVAKQAEIERVYHSLLPEEKLYLIIEHSDPRHILAMVGDDINDAPALLKTNKRVLNMTHFVYPL